MAKFRSIKNSLIAGEISPTAFGRTDLPQYLHACKTLQNMVLLPSGGAYRRPGSWFVKQYAQSANDLPRVFPFVYSQSEAYAVLLGVTTGGSGYGRAFLVGSSLVTPSEITISSTHPFITDPNFLTDPLHEVQYVQSADIMYFVHPLYKPHRLRRTAASTFTFEEFDVDNAGATLTGTNLRDAWPYRPQNTTGITLTPSATSGAGVTLTASSAFFDTGHVGTLFKLDHAGTIGTIQITGYTSPTVVTGTVKVNFGATTGVTTWWEAAWSTYRGWPRSICFFEQRLCYGGNTANPDSIWLSESGDYNQLSHNSIVDPRSSPTGANAFTIELTSSQINKIQWLSGEEFLFIGTIGDEWTVRREAEGGFGADNARVTKSSSYGSQYRQAHRGGNELFFSTSGGTELKAFYFNEREASYAADSLQILFNEFPKSDAIINSSASVGIRQIRAFSWDRSRQVLWAIDMMGNLAGLTRNRSASISAWHTHKMGGYDISEAPSAGSGSGADIGYLSPSGSVISFCLVPNEIYGYEEIWLVVRRKINGAFQYQVERILGGLPPVETAQRVFLGIGNWYVDSSVRVSNTTPWTTTSFSGFSHLEGKALKGTASNTKGIFAVTGSTVSGGSTTIQNPKPGGYTTENTYIHFGLNFESIVEPVRVEAGSQIGTAQGAIKRIHQVLVRFYKTLAAKVGRDSSNLETVVFRDGSTPMGYSPELFTGDKLIKIDGDYDRDGLVYIVQDQPLPFAVVSVIAEGQTYD